MHAAASPPRARCGSREARDMILPPATSTRAVRPCWTEPDRVERRGVVEEPARAERGTFGHCPRREAAAVNLRSRKAMPIDEERATPGHSKLPGRRGPGRTCPHPHHLPDSLGCDPRGDRFRNSLDRNGGSEHGKPAPQAWITSRGPAARRASQGSPAPASDSRGKPHQESGADDGPCARCQEKYSRSRARSAPHGRG